MQLIVLQLSQTSVGKTQLRLQGIHVAWIFIYLYFQNYQTTGTG